MHENQIQSHKWLLTINNPQDHGMTHDEIIDRAQKFNPDYFCMADEIGESGTYHTHIFLYSYAPNRACGRAAAKESLAGSLRATQH